MENKISVFPLLLAALLGAATSTIYLMTKSDSTKETVKADFQKASDILVKEKNTLKRLIKKDGEKPDKTNSEVKNQDMKENENTLTLGTDSLEFVSQDSTELSSVSSSSYMATETINSADYSQVIQNILQKRIKLNEHFVK